MASAHVSDFEAQARQVAKDLASLANGDDIEEFIVIIHQPGWTTPAEFALVSGLLNTLAGQAKMMATAKTALLTGARAVGSQERATAS